MYFVEPVLIAFFCSSLSSSSSSSSVLLRLDIVCVILCSALYVCALIAKSYLNSTWNCKNFMRIKRKKKWRNGTMHCLSLKHIWKPNWMAIMFMTFTLNWWIQTQIIDNDIDATEGKYRFPSISRLFAQAILGILFISIEISNVSNRMNYFFSLSPAIDFAIPCQCNGPTFRDRMR